MLQINTEEQKTSQPSHLHFISWISWLKLSWNAAANWTHPKISCKTFYCSSWRWAPTQRSDKFRLRCFSNLQGDNLIFLLNLLFQGIKPWNIHVFRCRCRVLQDSVISLTCQKLEKVKEIYIIYITRGCVQSISSSVYVRKTRAFIPTEDAKECCDIALTNCIIPTISQVHLSEETLCVQRPNTSSEHWRKLHEEWILVWTIVSKGAFFSYVQKTNKGKNTFIQMSFPYSDGLPEKYRPAV